MYLQGQQGSTSEVNHMSNTAEITIRRLDRNADAAALAQLAGKDTRPAPQGDAIGAFVDGRLHAAISLVDGAVIADPFKPTSELRKLLKLRASQMHDPRAGRQRRRVVRSRQLVAF
jgi:hypothetical protein